MDYRIPLCCLSFRLLWTRSMEFAPTEVFKLETSMLEVRTKAHKQKNKNEISRIVLEVKDNISIALSDRRCFSIQCRHLCVEEECQRRRKLGLKIWRLEDTRSNGSVAQNDHRVLPQIVTIRLSWSLRVVSN